MPNHTMSSYLDAHEGRGVREVEIRFMVAQLVLALAHMHAKQARPAATPNQMAARTISAP